MNFKKITTLLLVLVMIFANLNIHSSLNTQINTKNTYGNELKSQKIASLTSSTHAFISTWNTSKTSTGSSNILQIQLPLESGGIYNFFIDWGDSTPNETITSYSQGITPHNYGSPGIYTLIITGVIDGWDFNGVGDVLKIIQISQWGPLNLGTGKLGTNGNYFFGASNLEITASDPLNLTETTSLDSSFAFCNSLGKSGFGNFNNWNTSAVTTMQDMFSGDSAFNQDIGNWNVSEVTTMKYMFSGDSAFNQNIGNWSVSKVTSMYGMFSSASAFDQDIGNWNVSEVTSMNSMFAGASSFNQPIDTWNVSKVTDMTSMFFEAFSFDQPIGNWTVSNVTAMKDMFFYASSFDQSINNWDVSAVTSMYGMFFLASAFNQPIGSWNVSNVVSLYEMFQDDKSFNQSINIWNVSNVTDMSWMFYDATSFNQPIGKWNVSRVTNMEEMFGGVSTFNQPLGSWNVSSVTNMIGMFDGSLSVQNYNNLLLGWSQLPLQHGVTLGIGNSQFSSAALSARQKIITAFHWTIKDGGEITVIGSSSSISIGSGSSSSTIPSRTKIPTTTPFLELSLCVFALLGLYIKRKYK